mgnify:CR=1 FL=1
MGLTVVLFGTHTSTVGVALNGIGLRLEEALDDECKRFGVVALDIIGLIVEDIQSVMYSELGTSE